MAATQFSCGWDIDANLDHAEALVRQAARDGAQVILLQELFETPYFCIEQDVRHLRLATTLEGSRAVARMTLLARELGVVLPVSFFERAGQAYFNSMAMVDADGVVLGVYRKAHIPNGPGYQEKTYFSPGDTGFKVWSTRFGRIGVGICWDQWFPECARVMALQGAELLLYPTAIGSEPPPALPVHSRDHWQRTQQGHAAANLMPLVASNRWGLERSLQIPRGCISVSMVRRSLPTRRARRWRKPVKMPMPCCCRIRSGCAGAQRDNWFVSAIAGPNSMVRSARSMVVKHRPALVREILFVCLGNICRSPTVEGVARQLAAREAAHLQLSFDSAGTADYHIGAAPDPRSRRAAAARGYDISGLRARQLLPADFRRFDLLLAMDEDNLRDMRAIAPAGLADRARLFLSYAPEAGRSAMPDPYYGGADGFETVLDLAEHGSRALFLAVAAIGSSRGP